MFENLIFGDYSYSDNMAIVGDPDLKKGDLVVGKFCSIAEGVRFLTYGHHTDYFSTYPFSFTRSTVGWPRAEGHPLKKPTIIGNDVYIGDCASIKYGVTIGDGAVISANSFVVKNVKPYSIVAGNPAELMYYRFEKDVINLLLDLQWWNLPVDQIKEIIPILCSSDKIKLFEFYSNYKKKSS